MGTRSLTVFSEDGQEIVVLYRQMDGYPEGHGKELKAFLKDVRLVNGYALNDKRHIANGMGDLAAQVVAHFKAGVGDFYLYPAGTRDAGEEYIYDLSPGRDKHTGHVMLQCLRTGDGKTLYEGPIARFRPNTVER